ncbi:deaminase [Aureococcus anophagefferens]|nr:deaminase [Aureococcus anophagefferens]
MTASSTTTPTDDMWMRRALELAEDAVAEQGEVPVGCVFVNDNNVEIASAANETNEAMCATRHAELLGIAKCYFGCRNDKFGGCGSILSLHEGNFDIVEGLREAEAVDLFRRFYDRENSRTLGSDAHGDKRTRRRTAARDSGVDGATDTSYGGDDYSIDDYSIDDYSIGDYSMDDYSIDDFSNDDYSDDDYSNDYPMDDDDSKDPGPKTPSRRRRERGAARSRRREDVGGWNVPKVTTMEELFDANAAFNESVDAWDASTLTGVEEMLDGDAPARASASRPRRGLAAPLRTRARLRPRRRTRPRPGA